jgi:tetrapyrrole methylase family protein/MazG family protein
VPEPRPGPPARPGAKRHAPRPAAEAAHAGESARSGESGALPRVVIVGLGPAGPEHVTRAADTALRTAPAFLRTARHPAAREYLDAGAEPLDRAYLAADVFEEAYREIVETLVAAAVGCGEVTYAVPGSPYVAEKTVELLRGDPRIVTTIIPGLPFTELVWDRLGIDPLEARVRLVDAARFAIEAAGDSGPLLVSQAWSRAVLSDVKVAPHGEPPARAVLLHHLGLDDEVVRDVAWEDIDRVLEPDHLTSLYIPHLAEPVAFELARAAEIVRTLREECPWDAEQTHRSLTRHLLEEAYEAIEALEELGEPPALERSAHVEEELGDVLCQVLFHAAIAAEEGLFDLSDVAAGLSDKLIRRHPHVFAGADAPAAADVLAQWEQQKQVEQGRAGLLDGIPRAMPALELAAKYERRAATVGFGAAVTGVADAALDEALALLASGDGSRAGELLVGIARRVTALGIDPEEAARAAATSFRRRFAALERGGLAPAAGGQGTAATTDDTGDGATERARRRALWAGTAEGEGRAETVDDGAVSP